jgi:uncharacterized DUF497 family protein
MGWTQIIWDPTPDGNVEEHDLTTDEVEHVLENFVSAGISQSCGRPCVFGYTPDGRYIIVVYDELDADTIVPATAYEVPEP